MKTVLILEKSSNSVEFSKKDGEYILEGVFTEIGKMNRNNHIYDEDDFLPHVEELAKKAKQKKVLGELDHPQGFDISLKNVSHIIEDIYYDKENKVVKGKIRLLDTDAGKQAKALVDAGVPIHISSRAAGIVESDGRVRIKKLFTYDLVADPGFENAELKKVNESFGLPDDDNIQIFEMSKKYNEDEVKKLVEREVEKIKSRLVLEMKNDFKREIETMVDVVKESNGQFSSGVSLQEVLSFESIQKLEEEVDLFRKYLNYVSESLNDMIEVKGKGSKVTGPKSRRSILGDDFLAECFNNYQKYLSSKVINNLSKINEQISEQEDKLNALIKHNDYIVENLENVVKYSEYIGENLNTFAQKTKEELNQINENRAAALPFGDEEESGLSYEDDDEVLELRFAKDELKGGRIMEDRLKRRNKFLEFKKKRGKNLTEVEDESFLEEEETFESLKERLRNKTKEGNRKIIESRKEAKRLAEEREEELEDLKERMKERRNKVLEFKKKRGKILTEVEDESFLEEEETDEQFLESNGDWETGSLKKKFKNLVIEELKNSNLDWSKLKSESMEFLESVMDESYQDVMDKYSNDWEQVKSNIGSITKLLLNRLVDKEMEKAFEKHLGQSVDPYHLNELKKDFRNYLVEGYNKLNESLCKKFGGYSGLLKVYEQVKAYLEYKNLKKYITDNSYVIKEQVNTQQVIEQKEKPLHWFNDAPEKYKEIFEGLDEPTKNEIRKQAEFLKLDTKEKIIKFWESRDLRKIKADLVKESFQPITVNGQANDYQDDLYMKTVVEELKKRFEIF